MDNSNFKLIVKSPFYVNFKKHYCPQCKTLLRVVRASKTVWTDTPETEGMSFSMIGGVYQSGKVKLIWKEFECPQCCQRITVEKMKEIEGYPK